MSDSWIVERGEFVVFAAFMVGGYLLAAAVLTYLPCGTRQKEAGRLALSVAIVLAVLLPAITPLSTIIGVAAGVGAWAVERSFSGPRMAAAHLAVAVIAGVLAGATQSSDYAWNTYGTTLMWEEAPADAARIGVYAAAYALVTAPAAYAIAWLFNRPNLRFVPADATKTIGRGRVIGVLERLIILTLGLVGQWQAIGLVVAAKSIARFRNLEEQDFAEYYLVGTLASLLIALLVATAARAIT